MKLHNNRELFSDAVLSASRDFKIVPALIEKDYYVTLLLKQATEKIPGLVFKGGTSLSKCYNIIDRFSEDIDLTLDNEHFTQRKKRNANKTVIEICDELGFNLANRELVEEHSHGNYNFYEIEYPILFQSYDIKPYVKVEMSFMQKSYPYVEKMANSYLGSYLSKIKNDVVEEYGINPFPVKVQTPERTLVDKVFAICDYYLRKEELRNSRHIYDLSRLLTKIDIKNEDLKILVKLVREDRKHNKINVSAQNQVNIPKVLQEIIDSEYYKNDYEEITSKLLIKPVHYEDAIKVLDIIINSHLFDINE